MKRVVCGDRDGKSTILIDAAPVQSHLTRAGMTVAEIWTTPDLVLDTADLTPRTKLGLDLAVGETRFRMVDIPPLEAGFVTGTAMHRTPTVDLAVVLSGELDLGMEDGTEAHLEAGDCIVQLNGVHEWRNRSGKPCRIAFFVYGVSGAK